MVMFGPMVSMPAEGCIKSKPVPPKTMVPVPPMVCVPTAVRCVSFAPLAIVSVLFSVRPLAIVKVEKLVTVRGVARVPR